MRLCAAANDVDDRQRNGDRQRLEHAERNHADGRRRGDPDLEPADADQVAPRLRVDEAGGRRDDDRAENRLREVLHRPGEEHEHERDCTGRDETGDLRARSHLVVHRRARAARAERETARHACGRADAGEREQFLVRTNVLVVPAREAPCGENAVGKADEEDPDRGRHEVEDVGGRRPRERQGRQSRRDRAGDRDAVCVQVDRPGEHDRGDDDDQRRRQKRHEDPCRQQHGQRDDAHEHRRAVVVAELLHDVDDLPDRPAGVDGHAEQLAELRAHEHDRDAVEVADDHRPREVVREPAEASRPGEQEARRDEQREHGAELGRVRAARDRDRKDGRPDERRDRSFRAHNELSRGAEERVEHGREEQRVEAVDRRETSDLGVGHGRRHRERGDRQPREQIAPRGSAAGSRGCARSRGGRARAADPSAAVGTVSAPAGMRPPAGLPRSSPARRDRSSM